LYGARKPLKVNGILIHIRDITKWKDIRHQEVSRRQMTAGNISNVIIIIIITGLCIIVMSLASGLEA